MRKGQAARVGGEFVRHVLPAVIKPARTLWNEVIGFLFLVLGVMFGSQAVRFGMAGEMLKLLLTGFFTAMMLWFGVTSFLRARKISRS